MDSSAAWSAIVTGPAANEVISKIISYGKYKMTKKKRKNKKIGTSKLLSAACLLKMMENKSNYKFEALHFHCELVAGRGSYESSSI